MPGNSFAPEEWAEIRMQRRIAEFSARSVNYRNFRKRFSIWLGASTKQHCACATAGDREFLRTAYRPGNAAGCEGRRSAIACWHCRQIIEARDHDADPSKERGRQAYATTLLSSVKRPRDAASYSAACSMSPR
jgi:hypothetical protein